MNEPTSFEKAVLIKLFEGEHPLLAALRHQLDYCCVKNREFSGTGFYTCFETPENVAADDLNVRFGDVIAKINGLANGAGFIVYVEHGRLSMLEGYSYDEPWPKEISDFKLEYVLGNQRDLVNLVGVIEQGNAPQPAPKPTPRKVHVVVYHGVFLGEKEGPKESELKVALTKLLATNWQIKMAYLAEIRYPHGDTGRLLGLKTILGYRHDDKFDEEIENIFGSFFGPDEEMDVLFLTPEQHAQIAEVCTPFFERPDAFQILSKSPTAFPFKQPDKPKAP